MNDSKDLPTIKDKFDTDSAEKIISAGYPANKDHLVELIFWTFPNDPVTFLTFPYLLSLSDEILAEPIAIFLEDNIELKQEQLIENVFEFFINPRGQEMRDIILSKSKNEKVRALFDIDDFSLSKYEESSLKN